MADNDYGGEWRVKFSDGDVIVIRGKVDSSEAGRSVAAVTNQDGSVDRTSTPMPVTADITLADRRTDYVALMKKRGNWTFIGVDVGVTLYYTNAFLSGEPVVNQMTGEVTGLVLNCAARDFNKKST